MWQEIVANKETYEDEIVNNALQINLKRWVGNPHFKLQVLSKNPYMKKLTKKKGNKNIRTDNIIITHKYCN